MNIKRDFGTTLSTNACTSAWAIDEGRFGLKVWFQRRWCPTRVRPSWIVEDQYEWRWLYAAVEPSTGKSFFVLMPHVDGACLQAFLDAFSRTVETGRVGVVLDGSGSHRATEVVWPEQLVRLDLPAYSPELNPAERIFGHLRSRLANRIFADLDDLDAAITRVLQQFWDEPAILQQLTGYDWWIHGIHTITSPPP